ncbi:D-alanine--D-alanine ligase family protein [Stackebrandtia soli]|uniref:D-alanine--D-alanine ligase family protein n=1 Tax=Stackebrandtia soli TaxID=1892856 RepID=UPI0039EAB760
MKKIKVAVVLGGRSVEHAVSCASGSAVIAALDPDRFDVVPLGITDKGRWIAVDTDLARLGIEGGDALPQIAADGGAQVALSADPTAARVSLVDAGTATSQMIDVDVVFPVLHGTYGEDGTIQGLLEMADVPYVGSGVLASAVCMDKEFTKRLLIASGLPVAPYTIVRGQGDLSEADRDRLGLPVFVKPSRAGSSLGITKVTDWDQLPDALATARAVDPKVLVEAAVVGVRELECGVLEREDGGAPDTTGVFEVLGSGAEGWFDFETKYLSSEEVYDFDPALPGDVADRIRSMAAEVFTLLDCSDLARVDFFLTDDGEIFVNEINTMPGLTPKSGVPLAWAESGIRYAELVERLVRLALKRGTGLR